MFGCTERVAFYICGYPIMKYGITMGAAIAASVVVLLKIQKKFYPEFSEDTLLDLSFLLVIFGIIGARLWYVILNFDFFVKNPVEIIMVNHGGISIHGAIFGGLLAGYYYVKKHNLPFLKLADLYAFVLPLGQAVGRWGNFFNSEAFGKPCNLPWKLFIPVQNRPLEMINFEYFHPTFLYESILDFLIFFTLLFVLRKKYENKFGAIFFSYLLMYSTVRFLIEFIRVDSVLNVGYVPIAAIVSVVMFIIGVGGLIYVLKKSEFTE